MRDRRRSRVADESSGDGLKALQLIESVGAIEPFKIVPVSQCRGTVMTAREVMETKVRWAQRAGYSVLTKSVPEKFAPYNAVIRVSESGTEDKNRDYLAEIKDPEPSSIPESPD